MTLESDADRLAELQALGELVTGPVSTFWVIPVDPYEDSPVEGTVVESAALHLLARTTDVAVQGLAQGSTITHGALTYTVQRLEPDGTGMTAVRCEVA